MTAAQHMNAAAVAVAMAEVFRDDRAARRHWLALACADMTKAHAIRQATRLEAAERGPLLAA